MSLTVKKVPPIEPSFTIEGLSLTQIQIVKGLLGRLGGDIDETGSYRLYQVLGSAGIQESDGPFEISANDTGRLTVKMKRKG